jgi:hypothetical protein
MVGIGEEYLIQAAAKLGITGLKASMASYFLSLALQETIKEIPKEKLVEILEKNDISVTKKVLGVPTTKITLGIYKKGI